MCAESAERDELAYALITPYSLHKSRTGGIIARLLWANVRLVAARMYAPRPESDFIQDYCDAIYDPHEEHVPLRHQKTLIEYIANNFGKPNARGISNRLVLLVFRGPNGIADIGQAVGHFSRSVQGDNVRGTFGDFIQEEPPSVAADECRMARRLLLSRYPALQDIEAPPSRNQFFEPGALTATTARMTEEHLKVFRKYAYSDGGFTLDALDGLDAQNVETSMVILKPESFRHRNPLPGNLVDFFARTGLYITGAKILHLSVEEAKEFYALKLPQFREQLKGMVEWKARDIVNRARKLSVMVADSLRVSPEELPEPRRLIAMAQELEQLYCGAECGPGELKKPVLERLFEMLPDRVQNLEPDESFYSELAEELKDLNAQAEFNELIRYMTGKDPETGQPVDEKGDTVCMALLYSGENALARVRQRLKELRDVYGQSVLRNRAHASDPEEDPLMEMKALGMPNAPGGERRPCDVEQIVSEFYGDAQDANH